MESIAFTSVDDSICKFKIVQFTVEEDKTLQEVSMK